MAGGLTRTMRALAARGYGESYRLAPDAPRWHHRFTPAGEDWVQILVQTLVQAPLPAAPPAT